MQNKIPKFLGTTLKESLLIFESNVKRNEIPAKQSGLTRASLDPGGARRNGNFVYKIGNLQ
jgi:hypothetical protein